MNDSADIPKIAFLGFGEAAQAFMKGWPDHFSKSVSAYDVKTSNPVSRAEKKVDYANTGVLGFDSATECVAGAEVIFSMVTADQALVAGMSVARSIPPGCLYFDCNSCAPDTKRAIAGVINAASGRYVDVAVMAPVYPALHHTPLLVSGRDTKAALAMMERLDMSAQVEEGEVGAATTIKMVRSIMIKGLEALTAECLLIGRKAGVEDVVIESLEKTFPGFGWEDRASYMLERMMVHGNRRAAEMREASLMARQMGLDGGMSLAASKWQQVIGALNLDPSDDNLHNRADAVLDALALKPTRKE